MGDLRIFSENLNAILLKYDENKQCQNFDVKHIWVNVNIENAVKKTARILS